MKHSITTKLERGLKLPFQSQSLTFVLTLGLISAGGGRVTGQDATEPLPANVQSLQEQLSSGQVVTLWFAQSSDSLFYFPVLGLSMAELLDGAGQRVPFFGTNGNLLVPVSLQSATLCVTLYDYLKNLTSQNEILSNLRTNPLLVVNPPGPLPRAAAMEPERIARLVLFDPAAGNQRRVLSTSLLTDADALAQPKASFPLQASALASLRSAGHARFVNVEIEEAYRARFYTNDVIVNLRSASDALTYRMLNLHSLPEGRSSLLLSPRLPVQLPPGGSIERDVEFNSRVSTEVRLEAYIRAGATADPQLVQTLISAALDRNRLQMQIDHDERDRAVATILLADGLSITLALGHLSEVAADMRADRERNWSSAFTRAINNQGSVEVNTGGSVNILDLFGGSASNDVITRWNNSDYVNQRLSEFTRQLDEMSVRLAGDIPFVTGLRISDNGTVINVNFDSLTEALGEFTIGLASLVNRRSLMEYVETLGTAREVETLLVPRMEVGTHSVGAASGWPSTSGSTRYIDTTIPFGPFAKAPQVIACLSKVDSDGRWNYVRLTAQALNVQTNQFTLRISTGWDGNTGPIYGATASWTAVGQGRMPMPSSGGLASIGTTSGALPVIPGEAREEVIIPFLQSGPQLVNSRLSSSFSAIPGRFYDLESSTNLVDWNVIASAIAGDHTINFEAPVLAGLPACFFRVKTP